MKLLLDTCVWGGAKLTLESAGHDVLWVGDWNKDPGGEQLLKLAHEQDRTIITLDKDFGELAVRQGRPHSGIVRLVHIPAREQGSTAAKILDSHGDTLQTGALVTVDSAKIRIRFSE
jgi:predicted nuclease of predicted toxin-antitoxin system